VLPTQARVVTRWPSSHALLDLPASFGLTPGTFEGRPAPARLGVGLTNSPALVTFSSRSKTWSIRAARGRDRSPVPALRQSPALVVDLGSSHGVVKDPPLHRHWRWVSTPGASTAPRSCRAARPRGDTLCDAWSPSARSCQSPGSFRPCRSSRLRRFAPPRAFQVCCTLKPIMGFAKFQVVRSVSLSKPALPAAEASGVADLFPVSLAGARFARRPLVPCSSGDPLSDRRCREDCGRFPWTIPCGAPPFEAFPLPAAVPRQPPPATTRTSHTLPGKPGAA
jgi:hypothetical protein